MSGDDEVRDFEARHGARIRRMVSRLRLGGSEKKDAYDTALADAFLAARGAEGAAGLKAAIDGVLRALCADARRNSRRARREVSWHDDRALGASGESTTRESRIALWLWEESILQSLTFGERVALECYEMDGRSDREIATEHGLSEASIRGLRRRALQKIRQEMRTGTGPPE